jgi:hypothetical protein
VGSVHALHPHGDGDKCVCRVRISGKEGRTAAKKPSEMTCDSCVLRVLRTWQINCDTEEAMLHDGRWENVWPWDDPSYTRFSSD